MPRDLGEPARSAWLLPSLLSVIAGAVDTIGFLSLGLFTAHITGNLVIIAAHLMRGGLSGPPRATQILAIPVFIIAVAAVWFIAKACQRLGAALTRPLLAVQLLLLMSVLGFSLIHPAGAERQALVEDVTAMTAVSAMACQFALLRIALPESPTTAVMTGNLTSTILSTLDVLSRTPTLLTAAGKQLRRAFLPLAGFFIGCLAGAVAAAWWGPWAWLFPIALAALSAALPAGRIYPPQSPFYQPGTRTP